MTDLSKNVPHRRTMRTSTQSQLTVLNETGPVVDELTMEQRLSHQFQYFKDQFLEAASSLSIAVPLDIVEDKSGHIYPFLQASGPKYIFQIMQGNIHNIHLMRCALSVLIITTTLLRKRIQALDGNPAERDWASAALLKFSDSVTMGSCINILINTYNPVVQELILNLMAALITVSDDAIRQMLSAPQSRFTPTDTSSNHSKILSMHLKKLNSRLSTADTGAESRRQSLSANAMLLPSSVLNATPRKSLFLPRRDDEISLQEEYNSCLAHILSVVLLQKNRHLLLAAATDVIQAMSKNASQELCEVIARTPTCPLPLVEVDRHLHSKKKAIKVQPINPLGNKVIEWAGLKIPLKFLQKYHTLYPQHGSDDKVSTSQTREEYYYAHDSALLAMSSLIIGSLMVVHELLDLPGALDVLQLSATIYVARHPNDLDALVLNAMNTLQIEKLKRIRANEREQTALSEEALLRSPSAAKSPVLPAMRRSQSVSTGNRPKPDGLKRSATSADDFPWATAHINAAPAISKSHSQPVGLSSNHMVDFSTTYAEETEKNRLYLLRSADKITRDRTEASDFSIDGANELRNTLKAPIHQQPVVDNLLEHSLQAIDSNTQVSILATRSNEPTHISRLLSAPQPGLNEVSLSFTSYYNGSNGSKRATTTEEAPLSHGMSATRDFFGTLPVKPFIPKRIEAKDCIHPMEDLDKIRAKFQLIAQNAVSKIKHDGKASAACFRTFLIPFAGVYRSGKSTVSIEERARRVYSPKRLPSIRGSGEGLDGTRRPSSGAMQISLDGPDMQPPLAKTRADSGHFALLEEETDDKTPAWNSISTTEQGYFGFKLDTMELEEENALFDNFKPIFDYTAKPETAQDKDKEKERVGTAASGVKTSAMRMFEGSVLSAPKLTMEATEDQILY